MDIKSCRSISVVVANSKIDSIRSSGNDSARITINRQLGLHFYVKESVAKKLKIGDDLILTFTPRAGSIFPKYVFSIIRFREGEEGKEVLLKSLDERFWI